MATTVLGLKTFAASDPVDYNEINDNYNKIDNGVKTAMQGRAAHNLLDNSDFTNPVNQRGIANSATIERYTYFLDRWSTGSTAGTITLDSNGLIFNVLISQKIDPAILRTGTTVTAAAKFSDGTLVIVSGVVNLSTSWHWLSSPVVNGCQIGLADGTSDGIPYVRIGNEYGKTLAWAALYEGAYDASTLPAYQPKGYAAELAECQQRFHVYATENARPSDALDCCPPMILAPGQTVITQGTMTVDGKTLYYNSTDL